jgi:hypothetical protein
VNLVVSHAVAALQDKHRNIVTLRTKSDEREQKVEDMTNHNFGQIYHYNENAHIYLTSNIPEQGLRLRNLSGVDCGEIYLKENTVCVRQLNKKDTIKINRKLKSNSCIKLKNEDEIIIGTHPTSFYFKFIDKEHVDNREEKKPLAQRKRKTLTKEASVHAQKKTRVTVQGDSWLDNDCLFLALQFFTLPELSQLSRVSKQFLEVTSNEWFWEPALKQLMIEQPSSTPRSEFLNAVNSIPYVLSRLDYSDDDEDDGYDGEKTIKTSHTWVHIPVKSVTPQHHKLAVILSCLCENDHEIQLADPVKIGYEGHQDKIVTMPFYQYCYSVITGKEEDMLTRVGLPISLNEDDDTPCGIMPNVDSEFEPFVYILEVTEPEKKERKFTHKGMPKKEKYSELYQLYSDEDGPNWTPCFFNASGFWYNDAQFLSMLYPKSNRILVVKIQTEERQY